MLAMAGRPNPSSLRRRLYEPEATRGGVKRG
jgi:hypothetical protein